MKALEDKIKKLAGTNTALADTVRALQKEKTNINRDTAEGRGLSDKDGSDHSSSDSDSNKESPMFFKAREV